MVCFKSKIFKTECAHEKNYCIHVHVYLVRSGGEWVCWRRHFPGTQQYQCSKYPGKIPNPEQNTPE